MISESEPRLHVLCQLILVYGVRKKPPVYAIVSENVKQGILLTLSQTSPGFYVSAVQVFWKTLWGKEKLLITSNFSFSHSVFHTLGELSSIFIKFEIVVCKHFLFGSV